MINNTYGIWIGGNATVAIIDEYRVSYLRLKEDLIISILYHVEHGTVGVVYGHGIEFNANATVASLNPHSKTITISSEEATDYIKNHSSDKIVCNENELVYEMYDGTKFKLVLAEKIDMTFFTTKNEVNNTLPLAEKMASWGVGKCFEFSDGYFNVMIDTKRYSILFSFSMADGWIYCRVGQNGYCEKGRAMLSTVCIRQNEVRMNKDNLLSINEYKPNEDWFIVDGCSFPADGGWYWSVKEVTDDVIFLQGCGGDIYQIQRK